MNVKTQEVRSSSKSAIKGKTTTHKSFRVNIKDTLTKIKLIIPATYLLLSKAKYSQFDDSKDASVA